MPVFVGSTFTDMQVYRRKVQDALTQLEAIIRGMEQFGSKPGSPVEECVKVVQSCQLYVGVFGMRYGSVPDGYDKSITHIEYDEAQKLRLPSLIYILDENHLIPAKDVETGPGAQKLQDLKKQLTKRHLVSFFTTPEDLAARLMHDVPFQLKRMGGAVTDASKQIEARITRDGSRVHEQQVVILNKLARRLREAQEWFQRATSALRFEGEREPKEQVSLVTEAMTAASEEFSNGRLFIPEALVKLIDRFFTVVSQGQLQFALWSHYPIGPSFGSYAGETARQRVKLWEAAANVAQEQLPEILRQIEEAARDIIGVVKPT